MSSIKKEYVQKELNLNRGKRPILRDIKIRPNLNNNKKYSGNLEFHYNGFRYQSHRDQYIDINLDNINRVFYQPCVNDIVTIIHFNLKNPIQIQKKKYNDVQFISELNVQFDDINVKKSAFDEMQEEQNEKEQIKKMNREFNDFIEQVQNDCHLIFEKPLNKEQFWGAPNRNNCLIFPTESCLINITEQTPFIMDFNQVEIACFERIMVGLKNFDLVFVYKDLKTILKISSISVQHEFQIKKLLNDRNVIFTQSTKNFNWNNLLGQIIQDYENFVEDGGWNFLMDNQQEQEEEQMEEDSQDENFSESEFQSESESEYNSEYTASEVDPESLSDEGDDSFDESDVSETPKKKRK